MREFMSSNIQNNVGVHTFQSPTYFSENTSVRFSGYGAQEYEKLDPNIKQEIYSTIKDHCQTTKCMSSNGSLTTNAGTFPILNAIIITTISGKDFFGLGTPKLCTSYAISQDKVHLLNAKINESPDKINLLKLF